MIQFYTQGDLEKIGKEKKLFFYLSLVCSGLIIISLTVFLILSSYQSRLMWQIIAGVVDTSLALVLIYLLSRFSYSKRIFVEYKILLESENKFVKCRVLAISDFITTLPDKSRCYEVCVKVKERETIYYFSEIFSIDDIKEGECSLAIAHDYIKGIKYEN